MIVVLGRPALPATWRSEAGSADGSAAGLAGRSEPGLVGRAARIALAARAHGADVELVGSVGDDAEGDEVMVRLGRAGVGHAAVLRDPAARTPVDEAPGLLPRLDAADISLGLSYVADCRVLVLAEPLPADAKAVAAEAAAYHGAAVVAISEAGERVVAGLPDDATLFEAPPTGEAEARSDAFDRLVAQYAAGLDRGEPAAVAFHAASASAGWEQVGE